MNLLYRYCDVQLAVEDRVITRTELLEGVRGKQGLLSMITDRVDAEVMDANPQLKVISNYAVGYDNIDVEEASRRGIAVTNTPGVLTDATADMTWALLMDIARRVTEGDRVNRSGGWREWAPMFMLGKEVTGSTLGIIGLGRIGKAVAKRARGFNMQILYHSRTRLSREEEKQWGVEYRELHELLREADFVSLHAPSTPETRGMIGRKELSAMKSSAYLINTARGDLVDEKALVKALSQEEIAGAGLDVYEKEPRLAEGLKESDRVVLAPHLGSATRETRGRMAEMAAQNLIDELRGGPSDYRINDPDRD
ncbi:D-glycerate dehydrogenase [Paludifilum halophilum]|uniref:D-glycerate dehydrogenase n=2 Tax=Paludifilum halophilum TaxID=1642702 RepID=A0A235BC76_9BACL|nr:D-glycerate dehydrogenase [Paludifilum halophilum]